MTYVLVQIVRGCIFGHFLSFYVVFAVHVSKLYFIFLINYLDVGHFFHVKMIDV